MKVMNVGSTMNQIGRTSFNGLWGKEEHRVLDQACYDQTQMYTYGTDHVVTTKKYYPFANETDEYIKEVVKQNEHTDTYQNNFDDDVSNSIHEHKVIVMPKLNITEDEYSAYINSDLLSKEEQAVEDKLKLAGLKQFLLRNIKKKEF